MGSKIQSVLLLGGLPKRLPRLGLEEDKTTVSAGPRSATVPGHAAGALLFERI